MFNENTTHKQVAQGFDTVYSAGFVKINFGIVITEDDVIPHGNSASLNIESQPELDRSIIMDFLEGSPKIKYFNYSVKNHYSK